MAQKSMFKSVGFWGGITSIGSALAVFNNIVALYNSIPPELIAETGLYWQSLVAVLAGGVALFGRWRAKLPLGIFGKETEDEQK